MSNNLLQPDSDALHQSAIDVITHISNVMSEGCAILREHDRLLTENQGGNRLGAEIKAIEEDIRHVNEKLERVKRKELTMTIVAPTSAGKSTIINAIAGQDLLPSRKDAMTVLPTEIVFSLEVTCPKLILDKALMTLLREAWGQLHQIFQRIGFEEAIKQATKNDFPRENVIKEIFNSSVFPLSEEVKPDDIQPALIKINDLLRLCGIFGISTEFLSFLSEIPRIEVPFPPELSSLEDLGLGTLVLVDTPGPSEDKSLNLVKVVEDRLKKSSLILVVIDSEKIGQTDPAKVKKLVDKIADDKGRDRISIIVNRIDTRKKGDLTTEETLNLVQTQYEITKERIFETSALRAFLATNFQREKKIFEPTELRKSESFNSLGEAYYGDSWEDQKENISLSEMDKAANKYWQKSGFADFMEKAIAPLVTDAAPSMITIKGALNDISQRFASFLSCLREQKGILEQDIQQLGIEINQLEIDLSEVVKIYDDNDEFERYINRISWWTPKAKSYRPQYQNEIMISNNIDRQLDSLNGRVFARLRTRYENIFWKHDFYEIDLDVMKDTWKLIAEEALERLHIETFLEPSQRLGENFKEIINDAINLCNSTIISYISRNENIFLKAQKKIGKSFQFYFIPDLLHFHCQELIIRACIDDSLDCEFKFYTNILPKILPKTDSVFEWLPSELKLKTDGYRLDSNEISDNLLEISKKLRLKLELPINESIAELIKECREVKEFPLDTDGYTIESMQWRMHNFIFLYTVKDRNSIEYKLSKEKLKGLFAATKKDQTLTFNYYVREKDATTSTYTYFVCVKDTIYRWLPGGIEDLLFTQIDQYWQNVKRDYYEKFKEEKKRFLIEYKESLQYSISVHKETVNKYSLIKNECIRLAEIGTDLQSSIKHQQEYFKQY